MEYDIQAEPYEGVFGFDLKTGKTGPASGTKIKAKDKRARYESFVVIGELRGTLPEIVEAYIEARGHK